MATYDGRVTIVVYKTQVQQNCKIGILFLQAPFGRRNWNTLYQKDTWKPFHTETKMWWSDINIDMLIKYLKQLYIGL